MCISSSKSEGHKLVLRTMVQRRKKILYHLKKRLQSMESLIRTMTKKCRRRVLPFMLYEPDAMPVQQDLRIQLWL